MTLLIMTILITLNMGDITNNDILYIKLNPGGFVCVYGIEIHTVGPILTKFGMGA
jgi:hypothetical protein